MMENMGYGRERLKDIVEKEAEEEAKEQQQEPAAAAAAAAAKEQQQDDDEQYDTFAKTKLMHEGKRMKFFKVTGNLNKSNTKMIMEMRTKIIYSFKSEIHWGAGEIVPYYKTLTSPPAMFTSLEVIQTYIEECEQKWLDLDNEEVCSKAYLRTERTTEARGNYEGKVIFKLI